MSNLYRGHSKGASNQMLVHWTKRFQRRMFFQKSTNPKQELHVAAMFVNESGRNEQSLQRTFQGYFLPNVGAFGKAVSEEKLIKKSTNQKQELPLTAMFVYRSGRNEQSLQRTFHRCFLQSFGSFEKSVSEEKFFRNQPIRNKNCLWRSCLLTDHDEMSNLYRGPSQDASYAVSIHLAQRFQRRRIFYIGQSETRIASGSHVCQWIGTK